MLLFVHYSRVILICHSQFHVTFHITFSFNHSFRSTKRRRQRKEEREREGESDKSKNPLLSTQSTDSWTVLTRQKILKFHWTSFWPRRSCVGARWLIKCQLNYLCLGIGHAFFLPIRLECVRVHLYPATLVLLTKQGNILPEKWFYSFVGIRMVRAHPRAWEQT